MLTASSSEEEREGRAMSSTDEMPKKITRARTEVQQEDEAQLAGRQKEKLTRVVKVEEKMAREEASRKEAEENLEKRKPRKKQLNKMRISQGLWGRQRATRSSGLG